MVKPKVGRDRSRRNTPGISGSQAEGSPTPNASKSKNDEEQKRNIKVTEEPEDVSLRVTRSTTKVAKGKQKFKDLASDTKTCKQSANHSSTTEKLDGNETEVISEAKADVPKTKSLVDTDSKRLEKLCSKPGKSNKASAYASPLPAHMNVFNPRSRLFQTPKPVITDKQKRNLDSSALKELQALSSETKKNSVTARFVSDISKPVLQYSKDTKDRKRNLDLKTSKVHQESSSEKKITEEKFSPDEFLNVLEDSKDVDEEKFDFFLKPLKVQQERSSENAKGSTKSNTEEIETKNEGKTGSKADKYESTPMLHRSKDTDKGKLNLDLKASKMQQELSSEKKLTEKKINVDESMHVLQYSKDTDEEEFNFYLKPSKVQQTLSSGSEKKATELNTEGKESTLLQYSKNVDQRQLNLDLEASIGHPKLHSENAKKAAVSNTEEIEAKNERIIESKADQYESTPMLQCAKDTAGQQRLDLKDTKAHQELSSENEEKVSETNFNADESTPTFLCSNVIGEWNPDMHLMPSKAQQNLFSESEKKATVSNTEGNESKSSLECSNVNGKQLTMDLKDSKVHQEFSENEEKETETVFVSDPGKINLDLKASKVQKEFTSENKIIESKLDIESTPMLQCSKDIAEQQSLDLKDIKVPQEISSKNEDKVSEAKLDADESTPALEYYNSTDDRKLNLDLMPSKEQQNVFSESEKKATYSNTEGNESSPMLQYSKDIEEPLLNLDLKASKEHQEHSSENENKSTELITKENESTSLLHDCKLIDINEGIQEFNLNVSNNRKDTSEHQNQLSEQKTEECKETINLRDDINLCFEFDTLGNKSVLVDGKEQYAVDESLTKTFIIGEGSVKISFTDNQVYIFTHKAEIDCSIRRNKVVLKFTDNVTNSNSTPEESTDQVPECEDIAFSENHDGTNIAGAQEASLLILPPSAEMYPESGSENLYMSESKTDSSFVSNVLQERIQNLTEIFFNKIKASCDDFLIRYVETLNEGNDDTTSQEQTTI